MKVHYRILSLMVLLSLVLSTVSPVLAQDSWPSGRDQGAPVPQAPAPSVQQVTGPVPVPAGTVIGPQVAEETQSPSSRVPNLRRVDGTETVNLPGQQIRDRSIAPSGQRLPSAISADPEVAVLSRQGTELVRIVIHLDKPSLSMVGKSMTAEQRVAYAAEIATLQEQVTAEVEARGGEVLVRFKNLSSGFAALVPSNQVASVARLPQVARVRGVVDYELDLSETVPHIGGKLLQDLGLTGEGVNVAVLDSGIDYTHLAFGGPGTEAAFDDAYLGSCTYANPGLPSCGNAQVADPALFGPGAPKVKGGYDWLGENWPNFGPMAPDPNPIDIGGHGTHVADIIAGFAYPAGSNDEGNYAAKGIGMAPGANLWAYKVCASFSPSCNGVALLAAMDDAVDLDNNPATVDPADIINLSLGSNYGQPEDDLTFFVNQAVAYGSIVVASAGNSADKPYILGSPSAADGAISVAQTTVPSEKQYLPTIDSPEAISGPLSSAVWQNWSVHPDDSGPVSGTVAYGNADADGTNKNGCAAFTDDMTGKVVLMDRGVCAFTLKAKNASAAGAVLAFIGLVAPGEPFTGGDGGDRPIDIPTFMISQAESNRIKSGLAEGVEISLSPDVFIGLANTMVGSSSRGPRNNDGAIKPDIGAPGASISAVAGFGTATGPFGGTSGAAPMVSGAAALLKGFFGDQLIPQQYKALLMNTGNTAVYLDGAANSGGGGTLAPITRIGGGQVDVAKAYQTRLIAWDSTDQENPLAWTGSLSFGYVPVVDSYVATRTLSIKNMGPLGQSVSINSFFRYADDFQQGVFVTPLVANPFIPAGGTVEVPVLLEINSNGLKEWGLNKGSLGADGVALSTQEYDGYIEIASQTGTVLSVPWQVLPKKAADVMVGAGMARAMPGFGATINHSTVYTGVTEAFSLVDVSPNDYNYAVGDCSSLGLAPGCNLSAIDLKEVGVRDWSGQIVEFGLTVWDHPYRSSQFPVGFDIYIDANRDGIDDFVIFNYDLALNGSDGRNLVFIVNLATNALSAYFFTDSDFNTQNWILTVPAFAIGLAPGQQFDFAVFAFDGYFGGLWDCSPVIDGFCGGSHTYTLGQPRFSLGDEQLILETPPGESVNFSWNSTAAGDTASPSEIGLLFLHRYAPIGRESDHLLLAAPFVEAEGLELVADPSVTLINQPITLTATITNSENLVNQNTVWFSDGSFTAELSGSNEVPPVTTEASGLATFEVDFATGVTNYTLDATGLISPTAAHIHVGAAGVNGGVIHWLYHGTGVNAPDTLPATGVITLTQPQIKVLLAEGLYVNVHTPANPSGEIRGQITGAVTTYADENGQASTVITSPVRVQKTMYALSGNLMASAEVTFTEEYTIAVSADPAAGGTAGGGGVVTHGDMVTVTATANTGYDFVNWTEAGNPVSTDTSFSFTADGDRTLVANFALKSYTIAVSADPAAGGTAGGGGTVNHGVMVTVTATANTGYNFVNWTEGGNSVSTDASFSFTADGDRTLVANFALKSYTIAVSADPVAGGTAGGGGVVTHGDMVTVTATANTGYTFVNWKVAGIIVSSNPTYVFTATEDRTLVASFALLDVPQYSISLSAEPADGGTVSGGGTVQQGETVTVTATANTGYTFVNWTEDGNEVSTDASFSFTADGDRSLVANFAMIIQVMNMSVSREPAEIMLGESVTITAIVTGSNGLPMAGEIVLATDGILTAQLSGANEVPPNTSTATGLARFVVDPTTYNPIANTLSVNYTLAVEGLENFTAAHIHRGGPGVNGPVAYPLQLGGGSFTMNAVDLVPLLTGQLYVNVHTQGIPAGEIRGQIEGAGVGITDANGVATISFIPHYAGTVTIYVAPLSNPIALLRNVTVTVNTPPSMLYLPVISK